MNGRSKWSIRKDKSLNEETTIIAPKLCDCGYRRKIGGNGAKEASYFYDPHHNEWICPGCGAILGE